MTFKNICKRCGKEFESNGRTREFCSVSCKNRYSIEHTNCCICGKPMVESNDQRPNLSKWYCSKVCREEGEWKEAREQGNVKICPACGKEHIKDGVFCSKKCYQVYTTGHKESKHKKCRVCGKIYTYRDSKDAYCCSKKCRCKLNEYYTRKRNLKRHNT